MNQSTINKFVISTFVLLYVLTSCISTIHVIDFFKLSNPEWLAITLAVAFEVGAAASLASIIALKKMNKGIVWTLFFILTIMQAMGNTYYAYTHLANYQFWVELFGLVDNDVIEQKRILSLVSGAILPLVALGFIKSLVDYIKPDEVVPIVKEDNQKIEITEPTIEPLSETKQDYDAIIKAGEDAKLAKIMESVNRKAKEREERGETYENEPTALANSGIPENELESENEPEPEITSEENKNLKPINEFLNNIKVFDNGEAK